jgi:hypothetical protein
MFEEGSLKGGTIKCSFTAGSAVWLRMYQHITLCHVTVAMRNNGLRLQPINTCYRCKHPILISGLVHIFFFCLDRFGSLACSHSELILKSISRTPWTCIEPLSRLPARRNKHRKTQKDIVELVSKP